MIVFTGNVLISAYVFCCITRAMFVRRFSVSHVSLFQYAARDRKLDIRLTQRNEFLA